MAELGFPDGVNTSLNLIYMKYDVHRRLHTYAYYELVNITITTAYNKANGDPDLQIRYVEAALIGLRAFLEGLNELVPE